MVLEVAEYFRLKKDKAEKIIKDIKGKVGEWKAIANSYDIPKSEQLIMEKAFGT